MIINYLFSFALIFTLCFTNQFFLFTDLAVQKLSLGSEHSVCLAADGSVWAWGWNEHANTGTGGTFDNVKEPQSVKIDNNSIVNIFSGAGHNFIVYR